jgi:hypothetical protein
LIDCLHNHENIVERVLTCLVLSPALSGCVGELFWHQRCACHIINLIVKAGLEVFKPMLHGFRTAISFMNSSNLRIASYKKFCVAKGVERS